MCVCVCVCVALHVQILFISALIHFDRSLCLYVLRHFRSYICVFCVICANPGETTATCILNWVRSPDVGVRNPPSVTLQREGRHLGGSSTQSKRNNNNNVGLEHIVFARGWGGELKVSAFHLKGWHLGVLCTHFVNWTDCFRPSWGELPPKCSTSAWSPTLGG